MAWSWPDVTRRSPREIRMAPRPGRDPPEAWLRTIAFRVLLRESMNLSRQAGDGVLWKQWVGLTDQEAIRSSAVCSNFREFFLRLNPSLIRPRVNWRQR